MLSSLFVVAIFNPWAGRDNTPACVPAMTPA
jgi:hypothetical protein